MPVLSPSATVRGPASLKASTRSGPQALKRRVIPSAAAVFAVEPTKEETHEEVGQQPQIQQNVVFRFIYVTLLKPLFFLTDECEPLTKI